MNKKQILNNCLYVVASLAIMVVLWAIYALLYNKPLIVPQVHEVGGELAKLLTLKSTYGAVFMSILRTLMCYAMATLLAVFFALISTKIAVRKVVSVIMTVVSSVPTIAVILLIVVLYNANISPIIIALLVALPVIYASLMTALDHVSPEVEMCHVYNVSNKNMLRYLYVPALLPVVAKHCNTTLVLCLKLVVSAEVLAYTAVGIGDGLYVAKVNVDTAQLLAWTIICVVVCFVFQAIYALVVQLIRRNNGKN